MKKLLVFLLMLYAFNVNAQEIYFCEAMDGVITPLEKPNLWKKITLWFSNGVEKTKTFSDFRIVIDGENSYIQDTNDSEKTPLLLFTNTDEKAELLAIGTVASSIYSIDKVRKKVLQAKNGILPSHLHGILKIDIPYQAIFSSDCH